jgi:hypothetical protein
MFAFDKNNSNAIPPKKRTLQYCGPDCKAADAKLENSLT